MENSKSMLDVAYEIACENNGPISFKDLVSEVASRLAMNEEELNKVFEENKIDEVIHFAATNLSLDGRFVTLGENVWDLRNRHTFDKVKIDMKDVYKDPDEDEDNQDDVQLELGQEDEVISEGEDTFESEEQFLISFNITIQEDICYGIRKYDKNAQKGF